jgi:hypothetical protein
MGDKNQADIITQDMIDDVSSDVLKLFTSNKEHITKIECKNLLNIIFYLILAVILYFI